MLALHLACEACGDTARVTPVQVDVCETFARFAQLHRLPTIDHAEVLVDGRIRMTPIEITR